MYKYNIENCHRSNDDGESIVYFDKVHCTVSALGPCTVSQVSGEKRKKFNRNNRIYLHCTEISIMFVSQPSLLLFKVSTLNLYLPLSDLCAVRTVIDASVSWI